MYYSMVRRFFKQYKEEKYNNFYYARKLFMSRLRLRAQRRQDSWKEERANTHSDIISHAAS